MPSWKNPNDGSFTDPTAWDTGTIPGPGDTSALAGAGGYRVSLTANVTTQSLAISEPGAALVITNPSGLDTFTGTLSNAGFFGLDSDSYTQEGGSSATIGGTLTNTGTVTLGPPTSGLSAPTTLTVGALAGAGTLDLNGGYGATPALATLTVLSAAPGTLTAYTALGGNAVLDYASGQIGTIASGASLLLNGPNAFIADAGNSNANSAIAGLAEIDGTLQVINGVAATITGNVTETGLLDVDGDSYSSEGGSSIAIAGTLTNTGRVVVGPGTDGLSSNTTLTVGGLAGTGALGIHGSTGATPSLATLNVGSAAPGVITANTTLDGDSLLEYASGQVGTIASGSTLLLNGPKAFIADAGNANANSAIAGLADIDGALQIINGGSATIAGNVTDTGYLDVDGDSYSAEGGSSVTITGTLTNTGQVTVGPGTDSLSANTTLTVGGLAGTGAVGVHGSTGAMPALATLNVLSAAPGTLIANTTLDGDSLLEFASGQVTSIAANATLMINGPKAFIADAGNTNANSAIAGLTEIDGTLRLVNSDSAIITGNVDDTGTLNVDGDSYSSEGGSNVTITGTLTNTGQVIVGPGTDSLSANTTLTVGGLAGTGALGIHGSTGATPALATLNVLSAAPGTITANTTLDGDSLLEFASGQVATIAANAALSLNGPNAFIADPGNTTANSAIAGLTEIDGSLRVIDGASATLTGNVNDTGTLNVDGDSYSSEGGSSVTITGTLTDTGQVIVGPGTDSLSANTTLTVGGLAGTGALGIHGSTGATPALASLNVLSAAPGTLTANATLDGDSLLQFANGQITSIAPNATLALTGPNARVADAGSTASNSALTSLATIGGQLRVIDAATVSVTGNLTVNGGLDIDSDGYSTEGGSSVTAAGTLTNTGSVFVGPSTASLSAPATLGAAALVNSGMIALFGKGSTTASLTVKGAAATSGNLTIGTSSVLSAGAAFTQTGGATTLSGQLDATMVNLNGGSFTLAGGTLATGAVTVTNAGTLSGAGTVQSTLDNATIVTASGGTLAITGTVQGGGSLAVASGATLELEAATAEAVTLAGSGATLRLDAPTAFTGPIGGLTLGDTLSLKNQAVTAASAVYNAAAGTSTLTLALAGGGSLAYTLTGNYAGDAFSAVQTGSDSLVSVVIPAVPVINTPQPIQFGQVHAGAVASRTLSISNAAGAGAPGLDASVTSAGGAIASGSIKQLAQAATDTTDITVGLNTGFGGTINGAVTLAFASDVSGNPSPLPSQTVSVQGTVYAEAAGRFAPAAAYLHVGDPTTQALVVTNVAPANGFSENLTARVLGASGGITASGSTGQIAPGASDTGSLSITVPTTATGQVNGTVTADLQSVATGGDTLGTTDLGSTAIPVTVFVDNTAQAAFANASSGTLTQNGTAFMLDLGTIAANTGADTVGIGVLNAAAGPADLLSGSFASAASAGFTTAGLGRVQRRRCRRRKRRPHRHARHDADRHADRDDHPHPGRLQPERFQPGAPGRDSHRQGQCRGPASARDQRRLAAHRHRRHRAGRGAPHRRGREHAHPTTHRPRDGHQRRPVRERQQRRFGHRVRRQPPDPHRHACPDQRGAGQPDLPVAHRRHGHDRHHRNRPVPRHDGAGGHRHHQPGAADRGGDQFAGRDHRPGGRQQRPRRPEHHGPDRHRQRQHDHADARRGIRDAVGEKPAWRGNRHRRRHGHHRVDRHRRPDQRVAGR